MSCILPPGSRAKKGLIKRALQHESVVVDASNIQLVVPGMYGHKMSEVRDSEVSIIISYVLCFMGGGVLAHVCRSAKFCILVDWG